MSGGVESFPPLYLFRIWLVVKSAVDERERSLIRKVSRHRDLRELEWFKETFFSFAA